MLVVDVYTSTIVQTIVTCAEPQGLLFLPALDGEQAGSARSYPRLYVASAATGRVAAYIGKGVSNGKGMPRARGRLHFTGYTPIGAWKRQALSGLDRYFCEEPTANIVAAGGRSPRASSLLLQGLDCAKVNRLQYIKDQTYFRSDNEVFDFEEEADNLRFDAVSGRVLVGYGDGFIGFIDATKLRRICYQSGIRKDARCWTESPRGTPARWVSLSARAGDRDTAPWATDPDLDCDGGHPESFQLAPAPDGRIFVNVADHRLPHVRVFSPADGTSTVWALPPDHAQNFAMALDHECGHLYVCCRRPAVVVVYGVNGEAAAADGAILAVLPCAGDADDVCWDAQRKRASVVGGSGEITVIQRTAATKSAPASFNVIATVASAIGARTGIWYPSRDRLYVAAPAAGRFGARLLVYEPV